MFRQNANDVDQPIEEVPKKGMVSRGIEKKLQKATRSSTQMAEVRVDDIDDQLDLSNRQSARDQYYNDNVRPFKESFKASTIEHNEASSNGQRLDTEGLTCDPFLP